MRERKKQAAPQSAPPRRDWRRRLVVGALWVGVAAGAYFWGRNGTLSRAVADPPYARQRVEDAPPAREYPGRPVAYIHDTIPITREELGEYLIARGGKDRIKNLINKKIIDHAAKAKGIEITEAEVGAALTANAMEMGIQPKDFVNVILKRYGKTLFEWREDVVKPRLILEKMCRSRVTVERADVAKAYEALYGEKVDCKMIMWSKDQHNLVLNKFWPEVRGSDSAFDHYARSQESPSLAAVGGHIKPVGRYTMGDEKVEKVLFSLRPNEVSEVLDTPEGLVVFKCIGRVKTDNPPSFESVRVKLEKQVFDKKVAIEVGKMFQELQAQAKPVNFLEPTNTIKDVEQDLIKNGVDGKTPGQIQPVSFPGGSPAAISPPRGG